MAHESLIDWVSLAHMFRLFTHTHLSTPPPTSPRSLAGLFASGLRDFLSNFRWMISPQQRTFLSFFSFSLSLFFFVRILLLPFWRGSELRPARCLRSLAAAAAAARSGEASKEGFFPGWSPRHLGFSRFRSDRTVFTESRDRCCWNKEEGEKSKKFLIYEGSKIKRINWKKWRWNEPNFFRAY